MKWWIYKGNSVASIWYCTQCAFILFHFLGVVLFCNSPQKQIFKYYCWLWFSFLVSCIIAKRNWINCKFGDSGGFIFTQTNSLFEGSLGFLLINEHLAVLFFLVYIWGGSQFRLFIVASHDMIHQEVYSELMNIK